MMDIAIWLFVVLLIVTLLVGAVVGFFLARGWMKRYIEKNPPIDERALREMYKQMGRTPSEKQIRQVMATLKQKK